MAYIDCDKCSHGKVCAYRHQYDDHIVTCSYWQPVDEGRKFTNQKIVSELDGADVFLRGRAASKSAPLNEYDIEVLLGIANVCDEAADFINRQQAEIEEKSNRLREVLPIVAELKTEAIKEFAERLKAKAKVNNLGDSFVYTWEISNLVKEMTEGNQDEVRKDLADL